MLLVAATFTVYAAAAPGRSPLARVTTLLDGGEYAAASAALDIMLLADDDAPAAVLLARARLRLETGDYDGARADARTVLATDAGHVEALLLRGRADLCVGAYESAAAAVATRLNADPLDDRARLLGLDVAHARRDRAAVKRHADFCFRYYNRGAAKTALALTMIAQGVQSEDAQGAWRAYREAHRQDRRFLDAYLRGGRLAYDTYAWRLAREEFDTALTLNPNCAEAHAGLAALAVARGDFDTAENRIAAALRINPHHVRALQMRAAIRMVEEDYAAGRDDLEAALTVNPVDLETLSLLAAYHEARGHVAARDRLIARVAELGGGSAIAYTTLAAAAERRYRCFDMAAWGRKAMATDPGDWQGYYLTGVALLRLGEERAGYELVDRSFSMNAFNVWAYNLLLVMDKDFRKRQLVVEQTPHFEVKMDRQDQSVLWPYLAPVLEQAYARFTARYGIRPQGPAACGGKLLILILPSHSYFSARATGLPGLPAAGVCFGRVCLLPSPRIVRWASQPSFRWRSVVEHELLHAFTLQATDYRIPRWFGEDLSTWEEPGARIEYDESLAAADRAGRLLPVERLNSGFVRPRFPGQVRICYEYAARICAYLDETYGFEAIRRLLELFRDGAETGDALRQVTGESLDGLNTSILEHVRQHLGVATKQLPVAAADIRRLEAAIGERDLSASEWATLARGYAATGRWDEGRFAAERALDLDPGVGGAHKVLGWLAYRRDKDVASAQALFRQAEMIDPADAEVRRWLGQLALDRGDPGAAVKQLEAACRLAPRRGVGKDNAYVLLADACSRAGMPERAATVLTRLLTMRPAFVAGWMRLAEIRTGQKRFRDAADAYVQAMYCNPFKTELHMLAGVAFGGGGARAEAEREFRVALALKPRHMEALAALVTLLIEDGRRQAAERFLERMERIDPEHVDSKRLRRELDGN